MNFDKILIICLIFMILILFLKYHKNKENIENVKSNSLLNPDIVKSSDYQFIKSYNKALYQDINNDVLEYYRLMNIIKYEPSLFYYYYHTIETIIYNIQNNIDALNINTLQDDKLKKVIKDIKNNITEKLKKEIEELKKECDKKDTEINIYNQSLLDFSLRPNNIL